MLMVLMMFVSPMMMMPRMTMPITVIDFVIVMILLVMIMITMLSLAWAVAGQARDGRSCLGSSSCAGLGALRTAMPLTAVVGSRETAVLLGKARSVRAAAA